MDLKQITHCTVVQFLKSHVVDIKEWSDILQNKVCIGHYVHNDRVATLYLSAKNDIH